MEIREFENLINGLHENVKKVPLKKNVHYLKEFALSNGYQMNGERVKTQYLGRINQPLKIGLGKVVSKLESLSLVDDPFSVRNPVIDPEEIKDNLVRLAECMKNDDKIYAYIDKRNSQTYGIVSDRHTYLSDKVVYDMVREFFDNLGEKYKMRCNHDLYNMRIQVDLPNQAVNVGTNSKEDYLGYMITFSNSSFGHGALSVKAGWVRYICTNGLVVMDKTTNSWQKHTLEAKRMLDNFLKGSIKALSGYVDSLDKVAEAASIVEDYIDQETSLLKWLPDNFDVRIKEAQECLRIMNQNNYKRTAFWIAQGIAEVAKTVNQEDQERLEEIAGSLAFLQVTA